MPLRNLLHRFHRPLLWVGQWLLCALSVFVAFQLRFDYDVPLYYKRYLYIVLIVWPIVKLAVFFLFGLSRGWWRYVSLSDLVRLTMANLAATTAVTMVTLFTLPPGFPRTIYLIDFLLCLGLTAALRISRRLQLELSAALHRDQSSGRTLIYGADDAGVALLRELRTNPAAAYNPVGLLDDDASKVGVTIQDVRVLGTGKELVEIARAKKIGTVLVAIPSASGPQMIKILQRCREAGVAVKIIPPLSRMLENVNLASQIRAVAVEDLLGRSPVLLEHQRIEGKIAGRTVMVTGAAGSIGSELCRQIARFQPAAIVGFDAAETSLFHLHNEFLQTFPEVRFHAAIGSVQNPRRIEEVLREHSPAMIFHAAAYKHVPMMEAHMFEAVENNIFGTWNVATAAIRFGIGDFVLISTDKAVHPANIMGATKRFAELLILSLGNETTKFVAVRFGNVLGSNGSVVPLFKQQIVAGGPVTVTHPDMERYFMTIPEASQLVLQAFTMGHGGEVFVLDMGEPVKIVDLARNLILLSGLQPDVDIQIEFTGPRPGEKLSEELSHSHEGTVPTQHIKVRAFAANAMRLPDMIGLLNALRTSTELRDASLLVRTLKETVPDYVPSEHVLAAASLTPRDFGRPVNF
jgi:FlaA1/EpsC-like NDP-sugar epimerase